MKMIRIMAAIAAAVGFRRPDRWGAKSDDKASEHAELEKALKRRQDPLERGITAPVHEGKPISAEVPRWGTVSADSVPQ